MILDNTLHKEVNHDMDEDMQLPIANYMYWYTAITSNDLMTVKNILSQSDITLKHALLNGKFIYDKEVKLQQSEKNIYHQLCSCPLTLAACAGAAEVSACLIKNGSDVCSIDASGNNIIHGLILISNEKSEMIEVTIHVYDTIMSSTKADVRKKLLAMEDDNGLRPLELAATLAQFYFARRILETDDVYRLNMGKCGLCNAYRYNITDYESKQEARRRRDKSLLNALVLIQREHLDNPGLEDLLNMPLVRKWMGYKQDIVRRVRLSLFTLTVAYFLMVMTSGKQYTKMLHYVLIADNITGGVQNECTSDWAREKENGGVEAFIIIILICFLALCMVLNPLVRTIVFIWRYTKSYFKNEKPLPGLLGKSFGIASSPLLPCVGFILGITILCLPVQVFLLGDKVLFAINYVLMSFSNAFCLLIFCQFLPVVGEFILVFINIIPVILRFLLFYGLLFVSTAICTAWLANMFRVCDVEFRTLSMSAYNTFRSVLNMQDYSQLRPNIGSAAIILHVTSAFFLGIILINFLIAVMSDAVIILRNKVHILKSLCWCRVALYICDRWLMRSMPQKLLQGHSDKVLHQDNGECYIVCFEMTDNTHVMDDRDRENQSRKSQR